MEVKRTKVLNLIYVDQNLDKRNDQNIWNLKVQFYIKKSDSAIRGLRCLLLDEKLIEQLKKHVEKNPILSIRKRKKRRPKC